jgi:hypothetical protein
MRAARAWAAGAPAPADVLGVLRALNRATVRYGLVGEFAEVLHGSLLPLSNAPTIVARAGQRDPLSAMIAGCGARSTRASASSSIDAPARFTLETCGAELVVAPVPRATQVGVV